MDALFSLIPVADLLAFLAAGIVLNLTPGADVIFATACGVAGGPRVGAVAGLGVGFGGLFHVGLAAVGVSALIAAHPGALLVLQFAGAGYLLWLAWTSWRASSQAGAGAAGRGEMQAGVALWRGFVTNALNPKVALFVLAFLPQFTDAARGPVWAQIVVLGALFTLTGTAITCGYGALAGLAGQRLAAQMGLMNKVAAVMLLLLALRMAWG
jgi:threonine/homoserine/homoserine lactone efflux protein